MKKASSGNILIYVLIAVVLFGLLSYALTKSIGNTGMTGTLSTNKARLRGEEMINYASGMKSTIEQMVTLGNVLPQELDFVKQGETGYDVAPHKAKVYHPVGGGMNQFTVSDEMFEPGSAKRGWVMQKGKNIEWTQTANSDVIVTFLDVATPICEAINERILKNKTIPTLSLAASAAFINGGADDVDFTTAACPSCAQKTNMCVKTSDGANAFYNVVLAR